MPDDKNKKSGEKPLGEGGAGRQPKLDTSEGQKSKSENGFSETDTSENLPVFSDASYARSRKKTGRDTFDNLPAISPGPVKMSTTQTRLEAARVPAKRPRREETAERYEGAPSTADTSEQDEVEPATAEITEQDEVRPSTTDTTEQDEVEPPTADMTEQDEVEAATTETTGQDHLGDADYGSEGPENNQSTRMQHHWKCWGKPNLYLLPLNQQDKPTQLLPLHWPHQTRVHRQRCLQNCGTQDSIRVFASLSQSRKDPLPRHLCGWKLIP